MAVVWRMEFPNGTGPYQRRWEWPDGDKPAFLRDLYKRWDSPADDPHPGPNDDGLGYIEDGEFFGCATPEQVLAWFFRDGNEDARRYANTGMEVTVWEVRGKYVRKGRRQCVFLKREARLIGRWNARAFLQEFGPRPPLLDLPAYSQEVMAPLEGQWRV